MDLIAEPARARELGQALSAWPSVILNPAQLNDLDLLVTGALAPLRGFMGPAAYDACTRRGRLPDGSLWPAPLLLEVAEPVADRVLEGAPVVLREPEGVALGVLHLETRWVAESPGRCRLAGAVEALTHLRHHDFADLRLDPGSVRREIARREWPATIAVPTADLLHRREIARVRELAAPLRAGVLVQALVRLDGPVDAGDYSRVRCFRAALDAYSSRDALLTLLPLSASIEDARGAVLRALVARNYGCTHVVADRGLLQRGLEEAGGSFAELGVDVLDPGVLSQAPSEPELRARAEAGRLDDGFTFPAVASELERMFPERRRQGLTLFFTGLSGSGKSTIANAVRRALLEHGERRVTMLDGDLVRQHLSSELGFSREHRELNVRRIGFVAAEVTRHGGVTICAPIAPYDGTRKEVRRAVEKAGAFVLVFVDTPLAVCEERDPKGLYARARAGLIPEFTGVSDPYERPGDAEIVLHTTDTDADGAAARVIAYLQETGYLARGTSITPNPSDTAAPPPGPAM
ncbi:MAG TPA: adenylyl-sulfate kinase [Vicinamibacterales bacterium]|nr:adenylyl-sulfate kinase [Vicinamibacterales bacterium]